MYSLNAYDKLGGDEAPSLYDFAFHKITTSGDHPSKMDFHG